MCMLLHYRSKFITLLDRSTVLHDQASIIILSGRTFIILLGVLLHYQAIIKLSVITDAKCSMKHVLDWNTRDLCLKLELRMTH